MSRIKKKKQKNTNKKTTLQEKFQQQKEHTYMKFQHICFTNIFVLLCFLLGTT